MPSSSDGGNYYFEARKENEHEYCKNKMVESIGNDSCGGNGSNGNAYGCICRPASDLPEEMLDHSILRALAYARWLNALYCRNMGERLLVNLVLLFLNEQPRFRRFIFAYCEACLE